MKILGIDTTSKFLSLGASDGINIYEHNLELGVKQSALLVPIIKRVLEALQWRIGEIDYFACGLGPGSFTGMRVGIATIKGFGWSLKKPIVGISSLDILAMNAISLVAPMVAPILDAKRGLVYCSIYQKKDNALKRISPYMLLTIDEFIKKFENSRLNQKHMEILGDAVALYRERIIKKLKTVKILDRDYWYPCARNIIQLALENIRQKRISNASDIEPIYLYPKECQIRKV